MKIHEIITEATIKPYAKEDITEDIFEYLKMHCSEFIANNLDSPIWRGSKHNVKEAFVINPASGTRKSENTTNYYTLLMDNSPYMRGWPKRSKSLICSTREEVSSSFGTTYAVFPFDGAKIAICPSTDLWNTMINASILGYTRAITWPTINYTLQRMGFEDDSYESMIEYTKTPEFKQKLGAFNKDMSPDEFLPELLKLMSPDQVGFEIEWVADFVRNRYPDNEVWFSAPCVAVRRDIYEQMIRNLNRPKSD